jgi:hypothetical protein
MTTAGNGICSVQNELPFFPSKIYVFHFKYQVFFKIKIFIFLFSSWIFWWLNTEKWFYNSKLVSALKAVRDQYLMVQNDPSANMFIGIIS